MTLRAFDFFLPGTIGAVALACVTATGILRPPGCWYIEEPRQESGTQVEYYANGQKSLEDEWRDWKKHGKWTSKEFFMDSHYPAVDEPATADFILAVLRDMHRQECQYDPECDPDTSLSFDSTVAEWRAACDLLGWRELGRGCNQLWGINCPADDWWAVLEPAHQRRLSGVCEFIARHARRPLVRPAHLFGCTCRSAGAFLTVRSLLVEAGACAEEIAPSTPLAPYTRQYCNLFLGAISRLAPGALPLVRIRTRVYDAALWGILVGMMCLAIGACGGLHLLAVAGGVLFITAYSLTWVAARRMLPTSVEFGGLRTFRDLAKALAEGSPAEPSKKAQLKNQ